MKTQIELPKTVEELRDILKSAIAFYQGSPVKNDNKLNEALASSLNYANYDQLAAALKDLHAQNGLAPLLDLYNKIYEEFGKTPIAINTAGHDDRRKAESYWVVFENTDGDPQSREIVWLGGGEKGISEEAHPADTSCPLYFFELVPVAASPRWRDQVKWYWTVAEKPDPEQDSSWEAYNLGVDAYRSPHDHSNPYQAGTFEHTSWEKGFLHAKSLDEPF